MPRPKSADLQKHTLNLRAGDYEELQTSYPEVGAGPVIRQIISRHVDALRSIPTEMVERPDINL